MLGGVHVVGVLHKSSVLSEMPGHLHVFGDKEEVDENTGYVRRKGVGALRLSDNILAV